MKQRLVAAWNRTWFEFALPARAIDHFRWLFFGLVGVDAFFQIEHAPRYGAGGFNVSHVPALDGVLPLPTRTGILVVFLLQAYFAFRVAAGATARASVIALTALFGYGYFISQLNSYQHHYLLFLVLVCCCLVPWRDARDAPGSTPVRSWAVRLLLVQLSLLYLWAAIAKLDPAWLDGSILSLQVRAGWARALIDGWVGWKFASVAVIATELFLAVAIHVRKLQSAAFVVGVSLHVAIEIFGFEIGMFSWLMLPPYLLVAGARLSRVAVVVGLAALAVVGVLLPDGGSLTTLSDPHTRLIWFAALVYALALPAPWTARLPALPRPALPRSLSTTLASWTVLAAAVGIGAALVAPLPFDVVVAFAIVAGIAALGLAVGATARQRWWQSLVHVGALAAVLVLGVASDQALDHYRYWGGDTRRRGDLQTAIAAYEAVRDIDPTYVGGRVRLGDLYRRDGRTDDALAEYRRAASLDPDEHRAWLGQARIYHSAGDGADAARAGQRTLDAIARTRARDTLTAGAAQQLARDARAARTIVDHWQRTP